MPPVDALALLDDVPGFGGIWAPGIVHPHVDHDFAPLAVLDNDLDVSPLTMLDSDAYDALIEDWQTAKELHVLEEEPLVVEKTRDDALVFVDSPREEGHSVQEVRLVVERRPQANDLVLVVPAPLILSPAVIPVPAIVQEYETVEVVEAAGTVILEAGELDSVGLPVPPPPAAAAAANDDESESEMDKMMHEIHVRMEAKNRRKRRKRLGEKKPVYENERAKLRALGATESVIASQNSSSASTNKCVECKKTHLSAYECGLEAHKDSCRKCKELGRKCSGAAFDRRYKRAAGGRWDGFVPMPPKAKERKKKK